MQSSGFSDWFFYKLWKLLCEHQSVENIWGTQILVLAVFSFEISKNAGGSFRCTRCVHQRNFWTSFFVWMILLHVWSWGHHQSLGIFREISICVFVCWWWMSGSGDIGGCTRLAMPKSASQSAPFKVFKWLSNRISWRYHHDSHLANVVVPWNGWALAHYVG